MNFPSAGAPCAFNGARTGQPISTDFIMETDCVLSRYLDRRAHRVRLGKLEVGSVPCAVWWAQLGFRPPLGAGSLDQLKAVQEKN